MSATRSLADDFAPADLAAWRALAEKGLKGRPFDELIHRTADGLEIQPLYTSADAGGRTGPLTSPAVDVTRPWDLRGVVSATDPVEANRIALEHLNGGAASLLVEARGALADQDGLVPALKGVLLELASVALDAGADGARAADALAVAAKGSPRAALALHLDAPSAWATSEGADLAALTISFANTALRHAAAYPQASLFMASGVAVHDAGGTEVQELAFMAAGAVQAARAAEAAGGDPAQALARTVLGLSADQDVLLTIAKLRAARLIWRQLAGAVGIDAPARIEARGSRRMLTSLDAETNLLRQTAACFAAAVGGADAIALDPFDRVLGIDSPVALRQSRNIQLVLMEESHLGRVADPLAGAFAVEQLTDQLARRAWAAFQAIEAEGGLNAALLSGRLPDQVAEAAEARAARIASGDLVMIGVNQHPRPGDAPPPPVSVADCPLPLRRDAVAFELKAFEEAAHAAS
ncbi:methylmalonyl-CoA mutase family protein [Brevundimonas sp. 2R-24]|uniref:Methylmalonyl-CoA mutase family protein n=1 Tax=Peiella sedimenti TaxID=3061083 RepID=A0ABT8SIJ9_9CAUL|nr:methylmalonyl-CoA mutase family protein [Caulobacteraceae bacterium XZ-24]